MKQAIDNALRDYILKGWQDCEVVQNEDGENGEISLPKPFTPPCINGTFRILFYWDSYFANLGLLCDGKFEQAKNNIENFIFLIHKFGYVPNMSSYNGCNRSQPPLFGAMLRDYYHKTRDESILISGYEALQKEYSFWRESENRLTDIGLSKHGNMGTTEQCIQFYSYIKERLNYLNNDENPAITGSHFLSEAETGWDFTPRFYNRCEEYAPIDLNCILYVTEITLAEISALCEDKLKHNYYLQLAGKRKILVDSFCRDSQTGIYYDYNVAEGKRSTLITAASFFPYWSRLCEDSHGISLLLEKLEYEFGISTCEKNESGRLYQWDYPNMWPPLVTICTLGLSYVNCMEDSKRIASKYIKAVNNEFENSQSLWEKYDVNTGNTASHNEYEMTKMLGWTAGAYCVLSDEILNN